MDFKELNQKYMRKKIEHEQQVEANKESIKKFHENVDSLSDEDIELATSFGIDVAWLRNVDLQRAQHDADYVKDVNTKIDETANELYTKLEALLEN